MLSKYHLNGFLKESEKANNVVSLVKISKISIGTSPIFLLKKKREKLLHCKRFSHLFNKNISDLVRKS